MYVCFPPWGASILPHAAPESNTALHCAISHVLSTYPIRSAPPPVFLLMHSWLSAVVLKSHMRFVFSNIAAFPRQIWLPTDRDCWLQLSQRGFAASVRKSQLLLCPSKWFLFLFPMLQMYFLSLHLSSFGHACSSLPPFFLTCFRGFPSLFPLLMMHLRLCLVGRQEKMLLLQCISFARLKENMPFCDQRPPSLSNLVTGLVP